eukprot:gene57403-biopygen96489
MICVDGPTKSPTTIPYCTLPPTKAPTTQPPTTAPTTVPPTHGANKFEPRSDSLLYLWHGSLDHFVDAKLLKGIDVRTSGDGLFGHANYFADCASKSDECRGPPGGILLVACCLYTDVKARRAKMTGDEVWHQRCRVAAPLVL